MDNNINSHECFFKLTRIKPIRAFIKKIENRHGIIDSKERGKYKFVDNFLKEWIKRNYMLEEKEKVYDLIYDDINKPESFKSELVRNYIDLLKQTSLSNENKGRLLQSIRNETHKIYIKRKVTPNDVPIIKDLIKIACQLIKDNDEQIKLIIYDILMLLTRSSV